MIRLGFPSIVVASENDDYLTLERARAFAGAWGSQFSSVGRAGHINSTSGLGAWVEGRGPLGVLLDRPGASAQPAP